MAPIFPFTKLVRRRSLIRLCDGYLDEGISFIEFRRRSLRRISNFRQAPSY